MYDPAKIIAGLPIGLWVATVPDGTAVYVNPAFATIMGMEVLSEAVISDCPGAYGIFGRDGKPYPVERLPFSRVVGTSLSVVVDDLVIHRPDGSRVNVRAFAHPVFDEAGAMTHVTVAFIDITREVKAEVERDKVEARLAHAVDHAPMVIWSSDSQGMITLSQGAGLVALGVKSGELVGHNVFDLYRDHPTIAGYIRRGLAGESVRYTVEVGEAVFDTYLAPLRDGSGEIIGVTGLSHDVREIRKLQAAAIQNDRIMALGTLAASVAHEINNPLTYILGYAEEVASALDEIERGTAVLTDAYGLSLRSALRTLRADFETLRSGTERIASITRELRTFSHPENKNVAPVDVSAVVRSVLTLVGKEVETRARLVTELEDTLPVLGDAARLVQVVLNLVVNAMQALTTGSGDVHEIRVSTATRQGQVMIEVSDTGPGVAVANRDRIFEPFVTTKEIGQGTGLGLFVCRNIVRGYGGDVTVHDRPAGGALFRVTLPASPQTAGVAAEELRPTPVAKQRAAHVLVIDDDALVMTALCAMLERVGYRTSSESDGARGLERLLSSNDIDLAFCDLMMKGMTGIELHGELASRAPAKIDKVVFMTGGAFSTDVQQFLLDHPELVVEKPFDIAREADARLEARAINAPSASPR